MPLLSRHKSSSSSPTSGPNLAQQRPVAGSGSGESAHRADRQSLLCDSPMFGIRKQIVAPIQVSSGSPIRSVGDSPVGSTAELSSVPQQITRQQIHYAFSIIDNNHDGLIDLRDLSQMLANLGVPIDEAILSHVMSSASKRGDHRISENEFLDWIGHFVQVSGSDAASPDRAAGSSGTPGASRADKRSCRATRAGSGAATLIAQSGSDAQVRNRRGSGSGLALMRSLSSSSSSYSPVSAQASPAPISRAPDQVEPAAELNEAKSDLRAAFCVFDLDGDGFITLDEIQAGLKLLGESWSQAELKQLFGHCHRPDLGGQQAANERISIEDFIKLLL